MQLCMFVSALSLYALLCYYWDEYLPLFSSLILSICPSLELSNIIISFFWFRVRLSVLIGMGLGMGMYVWCVNSGHSGELAHAKTNHMYTRWCDTCQSKCQSGHIACATDCGRRDDLLPTSHDDIVNARSM